MDALAAPRQLDQPVATAVTIVTLLAGAAASAFAVGHQIAASLFLFGMLVASRTNHRGLVIGSALFATLSHLVPTLLDSDLWHGSASLLQVGASQLLWSSLYWMSAALLIWDPRHRNLDIEQIHEAFAHAPAAMALLDTTATIVHANAAFIDLVGNGDEPMVGSRLDQLIDEKIWEEIRSQRNELLSQEHTHIRFERDFVRRDGRKLWVSIYARMLRDPSGEARFAVLQALDLTEQRRAQRALAISESRFRGIIENTGELTLVIDLDGRISYANPKAYEVFGAAATVADRREAAAVHSFRRSQRVRTRAGSHQQATRARRSASPTFACSDPRRFLDVQFTGLGDAPGISGTVVTARITTDQVNAEKQLRLSESKFSTIFHSSPDAILILRN